MKWRKLYNNTFNIIGVLGCGFVIYRFNYNFNTYEKAIQKDNVFDVKRSSNQLRVYKEIYDPKKDVVEQHRLMLAASEDDKKHLKEVFSKYDNMDKKDLQKEIEKKKKEIEFLQDNKTDHQGVKLAKVYYGYEPSEDALKKLRKEYYDHRKKVEEEDKNKWSWGKK